MANQILNFRDETMNIQKNIQEISDCTEKIKMVNNMRDSFLKLRNMIVFTVISLVFWIFGFVVWFIQCSLLVRIIAAVVGALATWIIFKKAGGKMSAVVIAFVVICYLIAKGIFEHFSIDAANIEKIAMFVPIGMLVINIAVTFFTHKSFTKSANSIMPQ